MNRLLIYCFAALFYACTESTVETSSHFEQIELPDRTLVMLNKNSSLSYDRGFTGRRVKLEGEAFFDVTEGQKPFIVETALGEIKVLGTEFSVKSNEENLEVQVKEGLVEVRNADLTDQIAHGMKVTLKKGEKQLRKTKADLHYNEWVSELEREFKKLGKAFKKEANTLQQESEKLGRELKKEGEELGKELKQEGEKLGKEMQEEGEKLKDKIKDAVKN